LQFWLQFLISCPFLNRSTLLLPLSLLELKLHQIVVNFPENPAGAFGPTLFLAPAFSLFPFSRHTYYVANKLDKQSLGTNRNPQTEMVWDIYDPQTGER